MALLGKVLLLTLLNVAWWHPYEIAAFNQALAVRRVARAPLPSAGARDWSKLPDGQINNPT